MTRLASYTGEHLWNLAGIADCLFSDPDRYEAYREAHGVDAPQVYELLLDAAVALDTAVTAAPGEWDWYATCEAIADFILTQAPTHLTVRDVTHCLTTA